MIKARYNRWFKLLMNWYVGIIKRWDFHAVLLRECSEIDPNRSLLILANHFSWWDPFLIAYLIIPFRKKHHVMMLEEELRIRMPLTYAGAFGVNKKESKSMLASIAYSKEILLDPQNSLTIFPSGKIESQHVHQYHFKSGLNRIMTGLDEKVQVVLVVGLADYFSNRKPTMNYFFKEYRWIGAFDSLQTEKAFNEFMLDCLEKEKGLVKPCNLIY